jgi:hypothetical protein
MILHLVNKFNDTIRYNTVQYGSVRYQCNLIYVRFFTSNHEICAGRRPLPSQVVHYGVQSHTIDYWMPHFIGRLEHYLEDWALPNKYLNTGISMVSRAKHDSSDDPMGLKAALNLIFKSDKRYEMAVCHLVLVDYVCLEGFYEPPLECRELARKLL